MVCAQKKKHSNEHRFGGSRRRRSVHRCAEPRSRTRRVDWGVSALVVVTRTGHARPVYKRPSDADFVTVRAGVPLLRAGLERMVLRAGLGLVGSEADARVVVRTLDHSPSAALLDVCVADGSVTLTLHAAVDSALWDALPGLVGLLLDSAAESQLLAESADPTR